MKNPTKRLFPNYTTVEKKPKTIYNALPDCVFEYPFFNEGIQMLRSKGLKLPNQPLEILNTNQEEQLTIKGFIFHTSHCGSTLLVRMLQTHPEIRVISETEAINGLLLAYLLHQLPKIEVQQQLKAILESYCQPIGKEKYVVFKFTSWNVFMIDLFLDTFPFAKWIYLDRKTEEVVASLKKSDGGFAQWWYQPTDILRKYFTAPNYVYSTQEHYLIHMVEQHRKQVSQYTPKQYYHCDYSTLIDDFEKITHHFNLDFTAQEIENAKKTTTYYSKSADKVIYTENV